MWSAQRRCAAASPAAGALHVHCRAIGLSESQLSSTFTTDPTATPIRVVSWGHLGDSWPYFRPNFTNMEADRTAAAAQEVRRTQVTRSVTLVDRVTWTVAPVCDCKCGCATGPAQCATTWCAFVTGWLCIHDACGTMQQQRHRDPFLFCMSVAQYITSRGTSARLLIWPHCIMVQSSTCKHNLK